MNRAAATLLGRHDFSCFEKTGTDNKTSICTVTEAFWETYTPAHVSLMGYEAAASRPGAGAETEYVPDTKAAYEAWAAAADGVETGFGTGNYLYFRITADRFLRNMVRAVVGSLLDVGRGKRTVEDFASLVLPVSETVSETGEITDAESATGKRHGRKESLRSRAGESVPGHALFLSEVDY